MGGSEVEKSEVEDREIKDSKVEECETEESDYFEDCRDYPYFPRKSNQFQLGTPSNHQLLPLVHTITGHKRACLRDRTGRGKG